jgi:hypothetical protein
MNSRPAEAVYPAEAVEALERCGELEVDEAVRTQLLSMSAATIDRRLAPVRKRLRLKGRQGTKPGTLLRQQIAIRTFADWDEARSGLMRSRPRSPRRRLGRRYVRPDPGPDLRQ